MWLRDLGCDWACVASDWMASMFLAAWLAGYRYGCAPTHSVMVVPQPVHSASTCCCSCHHRRCHLSCCCCYCHHRRCHLSAATTTTAATAAATYLDAAATAATTAATYLQLLLLPPPPLPLILLLLLLPCCCSYSSLSPSTRHHPHTSHLLSPDPDPEPDPTQTCRHTTGYFCGMATKVAKPLPCPEPSMCCSKWGYCGSGPAFCDYAANRPSTATPTPGRAAGAILTPLLVSLNPEP